MHFLHRSQSSCLLQRRGGGGLLLRYDHIRTLYEDVASINCPRDRGLDHAVEREKHLKPLLNLKNFIVTQPSQPVPLSLINNSKRHLQIPFRPMDFIRKYPSAFDELYPGATDVQPHIKLTPDVVSLNSEEHLLYQSVSYKEELARRLLKLLMVSRMNKIPIFVLEQLKWELGLPEDYEQVIIPEFPDYFRLIEGNNVRGNGKVLELVCWTDEFAVSEMEKKRDKDGNILFPTQYSKEFEMDKGYKKWVEDWQKMPYVSPYENAVHLKAASEESDKWVVSVLHEVLNLFVGKKAERDTLFLLGEYLGIRSRFRHAFLLHPGIFYVSTKNRTHTVVLKEAYKRGLLIEKHPLTNMRYKYIQLVNVVKDEKKEKGTQEKSGGDVKEGGEETQDAEDAVDEEDDAEMYSTSDEDEDDDEEEESDDYDGSCNDEKGNGGGRFKRNDAREKGNFRNVARRRTNVRNAEENRSKISSRSSSRTNDGDGDLNRFSRKTNARDGDRNRFSGKMNARDGDRNSYSGKMNGRDGSRKMDTRDGYRKMDTRDGDRNRFSGRTNTRYGDGKRFSGRMNNHEGNEDRFSRRINSRDGDQNRFSGRMNNREGNEDRFSRRTNSRYGDQDRFSGRMHTRDGNENRFSRRKNIGDDDQDTFSRRTNTRGGDQNKFSRKINTRDSNQNDSRRPTKNFSGNRARSKSDKFSTY